MVKLELLDNKHVQDIVHQVGDHVHKNKFIIINSAAAPDVIPDNFPY